MDHLQAHLEKLREAMVAGRTVAAHDALSAAMATLARLPAADRVTLAPMPSGLEVR